MFARYGYSPADDSSFANRVFDPGAVDDFFQRAERGQGPDPRLPRQHQLLGRRPGPDRGALPPALPREGQRAGAAAVPQRQPASADVGRSTDGRVELAVESMIDGSREVLTADLVVYATGYRPSDPVGLLGALARRLPPRRPGPPGDRARLPGRHRRRRSTAGIYVQGATEHTHGLSSTLLSNVAVRSGRDRRLDRRPPARPAVRRPRALRHRGLNPRPRPAGSTAMSTNPFDDENGTFHALVNDEGQYSLWPAFVPVPDGWSVRSARPGRQECLDHIEAALDRPAPPQPGPRHGGGRAALRRLKLPLRTIRGAHERGPGRDSRPGPRRVRVVRRRARRSPGRRRRRPTGAAPARRGSAGCSAASRRRRRC